MIHALPTIGYWGTPAPAASLLLDSITTQPLVALGLRRLRSAYSGAACRVIRTSDSAQQDIGFSGNDLDTAALATFAGSSTCRIHTWYSQAGDGVSWTVPGGMNGPTLVTSGTLETLNSRPSPRIGSAVGMSRSGISITDYTALTVAKQDSTAAGNGFLAFNGTSALNQQMLRHTSGYLTVYTNVGGAPDYQTASPVDMTTALASVGVRRQSGVFTAYRNGAAASAMNSTPQTLTMTLGQLFVLLTNVYSMAGNVSEMVFYGDALSTTDIATLHTNQAAYFGL